MSVQGMEVDVPDLDRRPPPEQVEEYKGIVRREAGERLAGYSAATSDEDKLSCLHPDYNIPWGDSSGGEAGKPRLSEELFNWAVHATVAEHHQQLIFKEIPRLDPNKVDKAYHTQPSQGGEPYQATTFNLSPLLLVVLHLCRVSTRVGKIREDEDLMEWVEAFSQYIQWGPASPNFTPRGLSEAAEAKWGTLPRMSDDDLYKLMEEKMDKQLTNCYVELPIPLFRSGIHEIPAVIS